MKLIANQNGYKRGLIITQQKISKIKNMKEREKNGFYAVVLVCDQLYTHARTPDGIALSVVGCERTLLEKK